MNEIKKCVVCFTNGSDSQSCCRLCDDGEAGKMHAHKLFFPRMARSNDALMSTHSFPTYSSVTYVRLCDLMLIPEHATGPTQHATGPTREPQHWRRRRAPAVDGQAIILELCHPWRCGDAVLVAHVRLCSAWHVLSVPEGCVAHSLYMCKSY